MPHANNKSHPTSLRVLSGQFKGCPLQSPNNAATHPMGSREKLALFNLLQPYLDTETNLLDLYAGSGALGIEALGRGAKFVTFVEQSPQIAQTIYHNLQILATKYRFDPSAHTQVVTASSQHFLAAPDTGRNTAKPHSAVEMAVRPHIPPAKCITNAIHCIYNVILADPPYSLFNPAEFENMWGFLAEQGIFALSSPSSQPAPEIPGLTLLTSRTYAGARLTIYQKPTEMCYNHGMPVW